MTNPVPALILILGMPCSGGSVLAECLKILGVGKNEIAEGNGFSFIASQSAEKEIIHAHDSLLEALDFQWNMIGNLPENWSVCAAAENAKKRICDAVKRCFSDSNTLVVFDPRLSRLMPLWLDACRELSIEPAIIHISRHPGEIAASLQSANGIDLQTGHLLWMVYHRDAMIACKGRHYLFITYDKLLADPMATLTAIGEKLKIKYPLEQKNQCKKLLEFVRPEKKHHHYHEPDHPSGFSHFASVYDQLRYSQNKKNHLLPDQNDSKRESSRVAMESTAALLLMLGDSSVELKAADKTYLIRFFNDMLESLGRCETMHYCREKNQPLVKEADQDTASCYARILFFSEDSRAENTKVDDGYKALLAPDQWNQLRIHIAQPRGVKRRGLYLIPLNGVGLVYISAISLKHGATDALLWQCNGDTGFDECRIEAASLVLDKSDVLKLVAFDETSRISLPPVPNLPDAPVVLEVWIHVTRKVADLADEWHRYVAKFHIHKQQIANLNARYEKAAIEWGNRGKQFLAKQAEMAAELDTKVKENKRLETQLQQAVAERDRQTNVSREYFYILSGVEKKLTVAEDREKTFSKMIQTLERDFQDLTGSFRWRTGNRVARLAEILMFRQKQPLVVDHIRKVFDQFAAGKLKSGKKGDKSFAFYPCVYSGKTQSEKKINRWMRQLRNDYKALKNSSRWKLGSALINGIEVATLHGRRATAADHLEQTFRAYEKLSFTSESEQLTVLQKMMRQIEKDFQAISGSMRWKLGNGIFRAVDTVLLRGKMPTAMDHVHAVFKEYDQWRTGSDA